ncbi:MAG: hypothetical protein JKY34_14915 [Kordiimonadaceae bacterium]|nr:hypothetical protein [Kordiimonadaceae bacterium]
MKNLTVVCCAALLLSACATKQYGRVQELSSAEKELYTCREIKIEYQRLEQFEKQIDQTGEFNGRTVLGFLGDFGIGNGMAKKDARKSLHARKLDLDDLSARKGCGFGTEIATTNEMDKETENTSN